MAIQIDKSNLSGEQRNYLSMAQAGNLPTEVLLDLLLKIVADDDIGAGKEPLHPDWIPIFRKQKDHIKHLIERHPRRNQLQRQVNKFLRLLDPIDSGIKEIDPETARLSFLLGAGASKPSNIPIVKELLPDLLARAKRLDREEVTSLANFCEREKIDNIEDLLTAAQLSEFSSRNLSVLSLMNFLLYRREDEYNSDQFIFRRRRPPVDVSSVAYLQNTLQVLFGLLSSLMLPAKPNAGHEAIAKYAQDHSETHIITTNYDCCMDIALRKKKIDYSYLLEFQNRPKDAKDLSKKSDLIKLHGSLNWLYCETCQQVQLLDIEKTVDDYLDDRISFPVIGICRNCGGQRRGLLVPPQAIKFDVFPPLTPLLQYSEQTFMQSDVIVVVGFSFAEADLYISRMLSKAMQASEQIKMIIFDPDESVAEKMQRKFSARIPNFDSSRILAVKKDCTEALPKFLLREFYKSNSDSESTPTIEDNQATTSL